MTVIEVFPPPVPEVLPTSAATTPSNMSSPANGLSPLMSSNPSPATESHVSVIVNVTTPVTSTVNLSVNLSNRY